MKRVNPYVLVLVVAAAVAVPLWMHIEALVAGEGISWQSPRAFSLLTLGPLLAWFLFRKRTQRSATLLFSRVEDLKRVRPQRIGRLLVVPEVLRVVALLLFVLALARPQTYRKELLRVEGIDIMFAFDLSKSMAEKDMFKTRLDAGQRTLRSFLRHREGKGDRIGLVVFARDAMMQCPLTLDYNALDQIISELRIGDVPQQGTAIGDALGLSLAALRRSDSQSKVIILVSDGDSNVSREFHPIEARDLAKKMGVKVFTVLMGAPANEQDRFASATNPALLQDIAQSTNGLFFGADDTDSLDESFARIRTRLEKSELKIVGRAPDLELFGYFLGPALLLLLLEFLMRFTRWRRFP